VDKEVFKQLLNLSMLTAESEEAAELEAGLGSMIDYVQCVVDVKTNESWLPSTALGLNELRDDVADGSLDIKDTLRNAPNSRGRFFVVPKVVD
jgi:aspartyl/glutamyl-tRNA(Asn/Gln) amidotransferase C subunit